MSSESKVRILAAVSPRFPGEGSSSQGQPGAKARAKAVADAQRVDIPVPRQYRYYQWGDGEGQPSGVLDVPVKACRGCLHGNQQVRIP